MKNLTKEELNLINQHFYCTEPKKRKDVEVYVCERTGDLHFINKDTNTTICVIQECKY